MREAWRIPTEYYQIVPLHSYRRVLHLPFTTISAYLPYYSGTYTYNVLRRSCFNSNLKLEVEHIAQGWCTHTTPHAIKINKHQQKHHHIYKRVKVYINLSVIHK